MTGHNPRGGGADVGQICGLTIGGAINYMPVVWKNKKKCCC